MTRSRTPRSRHEHLDLDPDEPQVTFDHSRAGVLFALGGLVVGLVLAAVGTLPGFYVGSTIGFVGAAMVWQVLEWLGLVESVVNTFRPRRTARELTPAD